MFREANCGQEIVIPAAKAGYGVRRFVRQLPLLAYLADGQTVVADDFDRGIHELAVESLLWDPRNDIEGQLIVSTHTTLLLTKVDAAYIYIVRSDEAGNHTIRCIQDIAVTQGNHNNRNRYYKGVFGKMERTLLPLYLPQDPFRASAKDHLLRPKRGR